MSAERLALNDAQWGAVERARSRFSFTEVEYRAFLAQLADLDEIKREVFLCGCDARYFIMTYVQIYDALSTDWIPFALWLEQIEVLDLLEVYQFLIALKSRQVGLTWLALAYGLWLMLFRPDAVVLIFSRRDDEAIYILGEERLRGMYKRLPDWMKAESVLVDSAHQFKLSNGSIAYAFPTTAGDSYTATYVIVDEADLVPDLNKLMRAVKPTMEAGGKLFMLSRSNKDEPNSEFKKIYRGAKANKNGWKDVFLPWWVRPGRDEAWYQRQKADILERTGGLDDLHEQYPATDEEALAPASLNKRIPAGWLYQCYVEQAAVIIDERTDTPPLHGVPLINGLKVFQAPQGGRQYVGGMDCAEGLPSSDDSATTWVDAETGEEVASLVGKLTPEVQAAYSAQISEWYNRAPIMVENNNHGHAAILWLNENGHQRLVLKGHNKKDGWTSNTLGKVLMYTAGAEAAKDGETILHDYETYTQLVSIEKATLRAPEGEMDDRADSFVLALVAARNRPVRKEARRGRARGLYPVPKALQQRRR